MRLIQDFFTSRHVGSWRWSPGNRKWSRFTAKVNLVDSAANVLGRTPLPYLCARQRWQNLPALQLTADEHLSRRIDAVNLKHRLSDVETDCRDRLHAWLPITATTPAAITSMALTRRWGSRPQHQKPKSTTGGQQGDRYALGKAAISSAVVRIAWAKVGPFSTCAACIIS